MIRAAVILLSLCLPGCAFQHIKTGVQKVTTETKITLGGGLFVPASVEYGRSVEVTQ